MGSQEKIEHLSKKLELPGGIMGGGSHIELFANSEALIEGIKGVIEYNDCFIKLNIGRGTVEFWGNNLEISSLNCGELAINGKITKIEFCV